MASGSGFFKGEKKKKKKAGGMSPGNYAPVFIPPTIIGKSDKRQG